MIEDMTVRGFGEKTQNDYVRHVRNFTLFPGRSPDQAQPEDLGSALQFALFDPDQNAPTILLVQELALHHATEQAPGVCETVATVTLYCVDECAAHQFGDCHSKCAEFSLEGPAATMEAFCVAAPVSDRRQRPMGPPARSTTPELPAAGFHGCVSLVQ
jgi:hypothetical protein